MTLLLDRSTRETSVALVDDAGNAQAVSLGIWGDGEPCEGLPHLVGVERIIVGTGPGSFAGIRSALAFAQGYALGSGCRVQGLASAAAFANEEGRVAVIGDARRGLFWVGLFDGFRLERPIFQVASDGLSAAVPPATPVVSPDWQRICAPLRDVFGGAASPAPPLSAAALYRAASANPALLTDEPLPIYLNPAVRE